MNVCPSCGTSNPDSAKFCLECGTRLSPPPASEPAVAPIAEQPQPEGAGETTAPPEPAPKPKKDVSGAPPPWMPAPVTLSSIPSAQPSPAAPPPITTTTTTTTTTPAPQPSDEPASEETAYPPLKKDISGLPPSWMPAPVDLGAPRTFSSPSSDSISGSDPDWKMSDPGPLPDRKDRRLWLWIPVGLITAVLICCIAFFIWATTIGEDTVDRWATNAAGNQTEESVSGD